MNMEFSNCPRIIVGRVKRAVEIFLEGNSVFEQLRRSSLSHFASRSPEDLLLLITVECCFRYDSKG